MAPNDNLMMQQLLGQMNQTAPAQMAGVTGMPMSAPTGANSALSIDPAYNEVVTGGLGMLRIGGTAGQNDGTAQINFQSKTFNAVGADGESLLPLGAEGSVKFDGALSTGTSGQTATGGVKAHLGANDFHFDPYGNITKPINGQSEAVNGIQAIDAEANPTGNNIFMGGGLKPESQTFGANLGYTVPGAFPGASPLKINLNAERNEVGALPTTPLAGTTSDSTSALFAGMSGLEATNGASTTDSFKATITHQTEVGGGSIDNNAALKMSEKTGAGEETNTHSYELQTNYQGQVFDGGVRLDNTNSVTAAEFGTTTDQSQNIGGNIGLHHNGIEVRLDGTQGETTQASDLGKSTTDTKQGTAELSYDTNGTRLYTGTSTDISRNNEEGYSSETRTDGIFAGFESSQQNGMNYNVRADFNQTKSSQTIAGMPDFGITDETTSSETKTFTAKGGAAYAPKRGVGGSLDLTYGYETPQSQTSLFGDSLSTGGHSLETRTSIGYTGQQGRSIWNLTGGAETDFGSNGPGAVGLFAKGSWQTGRVNLAADGQYQVYGKENPLKPNGYRIGATGSMSI